MTHTNIVNGFKGTGLFPFDPHVIPEDAFAPSLLTERPCPQEQCVEHRWRNPLGVINKISTRVNSSTESSDDEQPLSTLRRFLSSDENVKTNCPSNDGMTMTLPQTETSNEISTLIQSNKINCPHTIENKPGLVPYSSSTDVSENGGSESQLLFPLSPLNVPNTAYCISPSLISPQDIIASTTDISLHSILRDYAVLGCSGLSRPLPVLDSDLDITKSEDDMESITRGADSSRFYAEDFYSFSSDENNYGIDKDKVTPKKQEIKKTNTYNTVSNHSGKISASASENIKLSIKTPFHEQMPTPNYATEKPQRPRRKALNYKGQRITKKLFEDKLEKENKIKQKRKITKNKPTNTKKNAKRPKMETVLKKTIKKKSGNREENR